MPPPRANIPLAITILAILALMPRPALRTLTYFNRPVTLLLAPVQQTAHAGIAWLAGPPRPAPGERTTIDVDSWNELLRELNQTKQQVEDLRVQVRDLSRGVELNPNLPVRQIAAPVIGFGTDLNGGLLTVRAGKREGVDANAVVVVRGVYLVGLVLRAEERTSTVMPITEPSFSTMFKGQRKFLGAVMLDEQHAGPTWKLDSISNGSMVGRVFYDNDPEVGPLGTPTGAPSNAERAPIVPDMLVRLRDPAWPASAQMLVIGRIERVDPGSNNRPIVTVRPLQDLAHVSEVLIRFPDPASTTPPLAAPQTPAPTKPSSKPEKPRK